MITHNVTTYRYDLQNEYYDYMTPYSCPVSGIAPYTDTVRYDPAGRPFGRAGYASRIRGQRPAVTRVTTVHAETTTRWNSGILLSGQDYDNYDKI